MAEAEPYFRDAEVGAEEFDFEHVFRLSRTGDLIEELVYDAVITFERFIKNNKIGGASGFNLSLDQIEAEAVGTANCARKIFGGLCTENQNAAVAEPVDEQGKR